MFLDEKGEKISKSKGNGLTIEQWLTYGTEESLAFYIYPRAQEGQVAPPRASSRARSTNIGSSAAIIRRSRSSSSSAIRSTTSMAATLPRAATLPVTFGLLLNLVGVLGAEATSEQVWGYLRQLCRRRVAARPSRARPADRLCARLSAAISSRRRSSAARPTANEAAALARSRRAARRACRRMPRPRRSRTRSMRSARRDYGFEALRDWFKALYETLLGSSQGPRMGSFIALYGDRQQPQADRRGAGFGLTRVRTQYRQRP